MTTPTTAEQIGESPCVIGGASALSPMPALSDLLSLAEDLAARHEAGGTEEETHDAMVVRALGATIARLEGELEVERLRLAACAVAAWGGEVRGVLRPYDSESLRAVVALRTRSDAAERRVEAVTALVHAAYNEGWDTGTYDAHEDEASNTKVRDLDWAYSKARAALAAASGDTATTEG